MKTLNMNQTLKLFILSITIILSTNSCTQSDHKPTSNTKTTSQHNTPTINIHNAVLSGNLEVVKQHIKAKTNINEKEAMSGSTPLISAATFGKNDIVKVLIDADANLNLKNNDGATALHTAAFFCRIEIVKMLIDAQADKTIKNNFGATPRESVMGSFSDVKPIYVMLQQQLAPLGLKFNMDDIEKSRPIIAKMLQ